MKSLALSTFLFLFFSQGALAAYCETFSSINETHKLCWNDLHKAWLSEACFKKTCDSQQFLKKTHKAPPVQDLSGGRNPSAMVCHGLKLTLVILKDGKNNEQSFCQFSDNSLTDANAIERVVK